MIETQAEFDGHFSRVFDGVAEANLNKTLSDNDVIISTFPKCGTTWCGQIAHGIRSNGDMSFGHMGEVVPWIEMGHVFGHDMNRDQAWQPALYKSHMPLSELPRGAKVINIIREPGDVLLSYYNFWSNTLFNPEKISIEMLAERVFFGDHSEGVRNMFSLNYYQHIVDFHGLDYDGPVLFLAYEDMKLNLPAAARRIARFMGVDLSKTRERLAVQQATIEFMARHKAKFSEQVPGQGEEGPLLEMVKTGRVGDSKAGLSNDVKAALQDGWRENVTPHIGYRDYADLRAAISLS